MLLVMIFVIVLFCLVVVSVVFMVFGVCDCSGVMLLKRCVMSGWLFLVLVDVSVCSVFVVDV